MQSTKTAEAAATAATAGVATPASIASVVVAFNWKGLKPEYDSDNVLLISLLAPTLSPPFL